MYLQNVRGLRTKLDSLINSVLVSAVSYDILIFVETWLTPAISSYELGLRDYTVYRCDRSHRSSCFARGGGVLIAVKNSMSSSVVDINCVDVEQLFVRVHLRCNKYLLLGAVYIPPASQTSLYSSHVDSVIELFHKFSDDTFCIYGDFNLPHAIWFSDSVQDCFRRSGVPSNESAAIDLLLGCAGYCSLTQINNVYNDFDVMLDLVFVSSTNVALDRVIDVLIEPDLYHPPLYLKFSVLASGPDHMCGNLDYRDFKRGDYPGVLEYLNTVDWDNVTGNADPEVALECLYGHINRAIEAFIPVRSVVRSTFPPWFSPGLRSLIWLKKRAHKAFKRSGSSCDYINFASLRARCKLSLSHDHRVYIDGVERAVSDNVLSFWKFVNTRRGVHGIPDKVHMDRMTASSYAEAANLFAGFFGSVYTPRAGAAPALNPASSSNSDVNIHSVSISLGQIYSKLDSLNVSKGPGFDGVPPLFLKECRFILARPLWHIFNSSLAKGIFPAAWKTTLVTRYSRRATVWT